MNQIERLIEDTPSVNEICLEKPEIKNFIMQNPELLKIVKAHNIYNQYRQGLTLASAMMRPKALRNSVAFSTGLTAVAVGAAMVFGGPVLAVGGLLVSHSAFRHFYQYKAIKENKAKVLEQSQEKLKKVETIAMQLDNEALASTIGIATQRGFGGKIASLVTMGVSRLKIMTDSTPKELAKSESASISKISRSLDETSAKLASIDGIDRARRKSAYETIRFVAREVAPKKSVPSRKLGD